MSTIGTEARPAGHDRISVVVVDSWEQRLKAVAIQAAVYLGEWQGEYRDHFTQHDFNATYLLAHVGDQPAGIIRVRWFAGFARLERLTILQRFRSLRVLNALIDTAIALCRKKGYRTISGLVLWNVVPVWRRRGGRICGERRDSEYGTIVPMTLTLPPAASETDAFGDDFGEWHFEDRILHEPEGYGVASTIEPPPPRTPAIAAQSAEAGIPMAA